MDTIKIKRKGKTLMIAHRGQSTLEKENTYPAFVSAGNRSYFGIECDVHQTLDGKFVIIHDDTTSCVSGENFEVEKSNYEDLRNILLLDIDSTKGRNDLRIPSLYEYISICKRYEKVAVLELKNAFEKQKVREILEVIENLNYIENTIFISFNLQNLLYIREFFPNSKAQFLYDKEFNDELLNKLKIHKLDIDVNYKFLTKSIIKMLHKHKIKVNCWTCDDKEFAKMLIKWKIDFITSNILE